jgi:hypothetical protein
MSDRQSKSAISLPDALVALRTGAPSEATRAGAPPALIEEDAGGSRSSSGFRDHTWALAASVALAALIAAGVTVGGLWPGEPATTLYEVVSETPVAEPANRPAATRALDVVFRPDATFENVDAALRAVGGQIVSGPSGLGVYRVELGPSGDQGAAARVLSAEERGVAKFAEPALR